MFFPIEVVIIHELSTTGPPYCRVPIWLGCCWWLTNTSWCECPWISLNHRTAETPNHWRLYMCTFCVYMYRCMYVYIYLYIYICIYIYIYVCTCILIYRSFYKVHRNSQKQIPHLRRPFCFSHVSPCPHLPHIRTPGDPKRAQAQRNIKSFFDSSSWDEQQHMVKTTKNTWFIDVYGVFLIAISL